MTVKRSGMLDYTRGLVCQRVPWAAVLVRWVMGTVSSMLWPVTPQPREFLTIIWKRRGDYHCMKCRLNLRQAAFRRQRVNLNVLSTFRNEPMSLPCCSVLRITVNVYCTVVRVHSACFSDLALESSGDIPSTSGTLSSPGLFCSCSLSDVCSTCSSG